VSHDVQLIVEYALQHSLADRLLGAEQVKQIAVLLAALVGLGIARIGERGGSRLAGFRNIRLHRAGAEGRANDALRLELGAHAFHHVHRGALGCAVERRARMRISPDMEAVLTICPPSPWRLIRGSRVTIPLIVRRG